MITIVTGNGYASQLMLKGSKEIEVDYGELFENYQIMAITNGGVIDLVNTQVGR